MCQPPGNLSLLQQHLLKACHQAGIQTWQAHRIPEGSSQIPERLHPIRSTCLRHLQQQARHRCLQQLLWLTMLKGILLGMIEGAGVEPGVTLTKHSTPLVEVMVHTAQQVIRLVGEEGRVRGRLATLHTHRVLISQPGVNSGDDVDA